MYFEIAGGWFWFICTAEDSLIFLISSTVGRPQLKFAFSIIIAAF